MAKEKHLKRKAEKKKKKLQQEQSFKKRPLWVLLPLILTFIAYHGVYDNEYINYDDDVYVTDNVPLRTLDTGTLFGDYYMNQYSPLAMTMMGYVFKWSDADAESVRFFSVTLHILSTLLVFLVFRHLFRDDLLAALLALIFGVHPMQVESVAWLAASMKIGAYSLFFLLSMWLYLLYREKSQTKYLIACFAAFVASCFSKEQAVVLPLALVLVDYIQGAPLLAKKTWLNKVPFLVVSLIFGVVTLKASGGEEIAQKVFDFELSERIIFATYGIGMYIFKLLVPIDLSFFYTYPVKGDIPAYFYAFPLISIALLFGLYRGYQKEQRWLVFGIAFFLLNVALTALTAVMSVRDVIMADRYIYLAILGVFFVLIYFLNLQKSKWGSWVVYVPVVLGIIFLLGTTKRVEVFQDSITLFTDVIEKGKYTDKKNPYLALPYNNRGIALKREGKRDKALADYEKAIACNPNYPNGHLNRGNLYFDAGKDDEALSAYDKVLALKPDNAKALSARGAIYAKRKDYDKAIADLSKAIEYDRYFLDAYSNRALTYMDMQQMDKALQDVSTIISYAPQRDDMYEFRGYLYTQAGNFQAAQADFSKAIQLNSRQGSYYYNRAVAYRGLGNKAQAKQDADRARGLGYQVPSQFYDSIR